MPIIPAFGWRCGPWEEGLRVIEIAHRTGSVLPP
jgi:hypothetical protein